MRATAGARAAWAASRPYCGESRFSTATPPPSTPSKISALASAIASSDAKNATCAASMLVITATCGRISRVRRAISPAWFIPASNTPNRVPGAIRASDKGTPHWLFRLPALAAVAPTRASAWRIASFTPVLPAEPVTATMRAPVRARAARPSASSAAIVSSTIRRGASSASPSGRRATIAAAAPLSSASATKPCPSKLGPASATNRSPLATVRLSMDTPAACQSRGRPAARRGGGVARCPQHRHDALPARAATAARATSASSNGRTLAPTIWPVSCPLPASTSTSPASSPAAAA